MRTVRVLHVVPSVAAIYGGTSTAVLSLVRGLREADVDACVLTTNAAGGRRLDVPTGTWTAHEGVPTLFFPHVLQGGFVTSPRLMLWLLKNVTDFDLIHLHAVFSVTTTVAARIASRHIIPYVVTTHGMLEDRCLADRRAAKNLYLRVLDFRTLRGASMLQAITSEEQATLRRMLDADAAVCPNPVNVPDVAHRFDEPSGTRQSLVYVGRIDPIKNIELVIDAFHLLSERNQDSQLTLIGGGDAEYVATLKSRAAAGPGAGRIDFAGPLSRVDVLTRLRNAAASVLVSRSEGLSMALLESLAVGTPAVVTQAAAPAIIRDSGAVLVSGSTPAHVAEAMEQIVFSAPTRHALAWRAADLVSREFATAVVSDRMKTLYRSVLESRA